MKRLLFFIECLLFGAILFFILGYLPSAFYYVDFNFVNWEDRFYTSYFGIMFFAVGVTIRIECNKEINNFK